MALADELEIQESDHSSHDDSDDATAAAQPQSTTAATSAKKKKKNKAKKKKSKAAPADAQEESAPAPAAKEAEADAPLDEVDAALKSLGLDPVPSNATKPVTAPTILLRNLVSIDPKHLDPDVELRRMFGASVVSSVNTSPVANYSGARRTQAQRIMNVHQKAKSIFAKPTPTWSPVQWVKSGLSMEVDHSYKSTEQFFTYVHSKGYKVVQYELLAAVASSDVQALMALLRTNPYHIDTLLVLSDMSAQQGDPGQSLDFCQRALYGFEGSFAPGFSFVNGTARLVFDNIENRAMFRALDKRVNSFMKKGTWRSACETAKALFALDPWSDPYGALLHLDFLCVKAKQGHWLLQLLDHLPGIYEEAGVPSDGRLKLETYPGLAFAKALILFDQEEASKTPHEASQTQLVQAMLTFPFMVPVLFNKLGLNIPPAFLDHPRGGLRTSFDSSKPDSFLHMLAHLYVSRSESLFKPPEILEWLQSAARQAESSLNDSTQASVRLSQSFADGSRLYGQDIVPAGILRHIVAADIPELRSHMPPGLLASIESSVDPLPPQGGSAYDDEYFRGVISTSAASTGRGGGQGPRVSRDRLRAVFQELLGAGAGGEQIDPELREAIEAQLGMLQQQQQGGNGGGLPGGLDDIDSDEEVEEQVQDAQQPAEAADEGAQQTPQPQQQQQQGWGQMFQSWFGLGGGAQDPEQSNNEQQ